MSFSFSSVVLVEIGVLSFTFPFAYMIVFISIGLRIRYPFMKNLIYPLFSSINSWFISTRMEANLVSASDIFWVKELNLKLLSPISIATLPSEDPSQALRDEMAAIFNSIQWTRK